MAKLKAESIKQKADKSYDFELSPALVGKFELRNTHLPRVHFDEHWYDFRTMSLETAERLVKKSETFLYRLPAER